MLLGATVVSARAQSCWRLRKAATPAANAEQREIWLKTLEAHGRHEVTGNLVVDAVSEDQPGARRAADARRKGRRVLTWK